MNIRDLPLPRRAKNALLNANIETVEELDKLSELNLWYIPDLGKIGRSQIKECLADYHNRREAAVVDDNRFISGDYT